MPTRLVIPLALLALVAPACSASDESADTAPPMSQPSAPPSTTIEATTSTTDATTTTTTMTTNTTTTATTVPATTQPIDPPTTPAPTTPVLTAATFPLPVPDGVTLEEVQVIDRDFREGFRRYYEVLADPTNEALAQSALDYTAGFEYDDFSDTIDLFRTRNRRVELLPSTLLSFEILQGPIRLQNPDEVRLVLCHIAPFITYDTSSDGTRTIVNDGVVTQQLVIDLHLEDGVWKRIGQFLDDQWKGVVRCLDASSADQ